MSQSLSLLVVDDEYNLRNLLERFLKKNGHIVFTAENAKTALDLVEKHHVDIVISDIKMPDMNGIELLKAIKKLDDTIQVIMITAYATVETAVEAMKAGASDYVMKPFDLNDIMTSIENTCLAINPDDTELETDLSYQPHEFLQSKSPSMLKVAELVKKVAASNASVLLFGETGTGKELAAKAIHELGARHNMPLIKINCAALPETLLESELFGYEKGAFTGAVVQKPGRFELADGGTLFLDEIGEISPVLQVKLLRVLQEREFERLGGTKSIKVDVRLIAATNRNLQNMVKEGSFREDLYYRLNVVPISLPPLRDRKADIPDLINQFLNRASRISDKPAKGFSQAALEKLLQWKWPGNIRELENIVERCIVVSSGNIIDLHDLPEYLRVSATPGAKIKTDSEKLDEAVDSAEKEVILNALINCDGNRTKASAQLGISRRSLHRKLQKYEITQ